MVAWNEVMHPLFLATWASQAVWFLWLFGEQSAQASSYAKIWRLLTKRNMMSCWWESIEKMSQLFVNKLQVSAVFPLEKVYFKQYVL